MLSELNTFCRNASTTDSECGRNILLEQVMKNTMKFSLCRAIDVDI